MISLIGAYGYPVEDDSSIAAIRRAVDHARRSRATVLVVCPDVPGMLARIRGMYPEAAVSTVSMRAVFFDGTSIVVVDNATDVQLLAGVPLVAMVVDGEPIHNILPLVELYNRPTLRYLYFSQA